MAEKSLSAIEHALENQRLGGLQIRVAVICGLIQMCDGYDVGSIGWSVPSLTHAWDIAPPAFALAFLWSNIGVMVGALLAGPIGDRFGRKPLLMMSVDALRSRLAGKRCFPLARVPGGDALLHRRWDCRRVCGNRGADRRLHAAAPARDDDHADLYRGAARRLCRRPARRPCCCTKGSAGRSSSSSAASSRWSCWRSQRYGCLNRRACSRRVLTSHRTTTRCCSGSPSRRRRKQAHAIDVARGNPIRMLFGEGYALQTTLLWIIFFCSLLDLFLFIFWLPEVLHLSGMTPAQAVFATSLYPLGGMLAVLYLGWAIDRFGARRSLAVHYAVGIVFIALISLVAMPYFALLVVVLMSGMTVLGSQTGLNAACGKLYPARMRTSGYGFATGVGRLGGIAAAPLGGYLLACGLPPPYVFLSACLFAAIAAVATALLALPGRQPSATPAIEAA